MGEHFKMNQNYKNPKFFFEIMKTSCYRSPKTNSYQIKTSYQIYFDCIKKEGGPVIAESDLLFMKISLRLVNGKKNYFQSLSSH